MKIVRNSDADFKKSLWARMLTSDPTFFDRIEKARAGIEESDYDDAEEFVDALFTKLREPKRAKEKDPFSLLESSVADLGEHKIFDDIGFIADHTPLLKKCLNSTLEFNIRDFKDAGPTIRSLLRDPSLGMSIDKISLSVTADVITENGVLKYPQDFPAGGQYSQPTFSVGAITSPETTWGEGAGNGQFIFDFDPITLAKERRTMITVPQKQMLSLRKELAKQGTVKNVKIEEIAFHVGLFAEGIALDTGTFRSYKIWRGPLKVDPLGDVATMSSDREDVEITMEIIPVRIEKYKDSDNIHIRRLNHPRNP